VNRIRVQFIIGQLTYGGTERHLVETVKRLDPDRFQVQVVSLTPGGPLARLLQAAGADLVEVPLLKGPGWPAARVKPVVRRFAPHVVYTFTYLANFWGRLAAARAKAPVIISAFRNLRKIWYEPVLTRLTTAVICNSRQLQDFYRRTYRISPHQVLYLPNGVDMELYHEVDRQMARLRLGLDPQAPLAVLVARFHPQKDHVTALKALKLVRQSRPDARLILVGAGDRNGSLGRLVEELGLGDAVDQIEATDRVEEVYSAAELGILSSLFEGLPRAAVECLACRRPMVATEVGGVAEIVAHGRNGFLVPPRDPAALAASWLELIQDEDLRRRLGTAGRRFVEQHYNLERTMARLEEILVELAPRPKLVPVPRPLQPAPGLEPPRLSVVIPAYNEAEYIGQTLEHLAPFRQRFGLEVIVSDDGSSDRTCQIAAPLCDKLVTPRAGDMTGPGAARNRGALAASAPLIFFQDADILADQPERFFERVFQVLADQEVIAATCRLAVYPEMARFGEKTFHFCQSHLMAFENRLGIHVAGGWCQIVRRDYFFRIDGYNEYLPMSQDVDLFVRLGKLGRVVYLKDLRVLESPRRYRSDGLVQTAWSWSINALAVMAWQKSVVNYRAQRLNSQSSGQES